MEGQIVPHLLALTAARGTIATGAGRAFRWLGLPGPAPDREAALAELARRYLRGHGPAGAADLAAWSGLGLRATRARAWPRSSARSRRAASWSTSRTGRTRRSRRRGCCPRSTRTCSAGGTAGSPSAPGTRAACIPAAASSGATWIARGRAVATWSLREGRVALDPFAPLPAGVAAALRREAEAVERFARAPAAPGGA